MGLVSFIKNRPALNSIIAVYTHFKHFRRSENVDDNTGDLVWGTS